MLGRGITLKQLEALVQVADRGSFRKAAEHLNTTQPNISSRIAALETALDLRVMERDAGSVRLTEKGQEILDCARDTLRQIERLFEITERPDLIDDRLRLGVTEVVACTWLRPYLRSVKNHYPNLSIELKVDLSANLDRELAMNALDLTIQTAPFATPTTGMIDLGADPYVWTVSPGLISDIDGLPILTHARNTQAHGELAEYLKTQPQKSELVPSNSLMSSLHMAIDGMGVAVLPRSVATPALRNGTLKSVSKDWHPTALKLTARFHEETAPGFVKKAAYQARETAHAFKA